MGDGLGNGVGNGVGAGTDARTSVTNALPPELGPVAAVVVDTPLAHLDRVFEYAVPADQSADAVPGARVRVRFAGRDLEGFVVARRAEAEHEGRLTPLRKVVSPEPVLTPEILDLCRAVADRYAGTLSDVLRLAVPKRHATAERNLPLLPAADPDPDPDPDPAPGAAEAEVHAPHAEAAPHPPAADLRRRPPPRRPTAASGRSASAECRRRAPSP